MAKTGRASGAAEKKAAVVRKQQEKVAARRRIKEEKIKKKNEKVFAKSLQNYSKGPTREPGRSWTKPWMIIRGGSVASRT